MARYDEEWDREREMRDRDRERGYYDERVRREGPGSQRGSDYGSHAGWGGQGFSQGSFGNYGSQGDRLYNQYGGQGSESHVGRQVGGGLSHYSMRTDERYAGEGYPDRRPGSEYEHFGRQSGPGYSRQESNWGRGYEDDRSYDRNRISERSRFSQNLSQPWNQSG